MSMCISNNTDGTVSIRSGSRFYRLLTYVNEAAAGLMACEGFSFS